MSSNVGAAAPARSYLFAPGNNEKLVGRVFEAGADAVVLDLEDAVPHEQKNAARTVVASRLAELGDSPASSVNVRVNAVDTGRAEDDIGAVAMPGLSAIRLPKAERIEDVQSVSRWIAAAERRYGMAEGTIRLDLTIETALGIVNAHALAACDARLRHLVFGQADFLADIGGDLGPSGLETLHARSELVLAARAASLAQPIEGAYTTLSDLDGLAQTALFVRRLGFFGMSAIHPTQVPVINRAFTPTAQEVEHAQMLLTRYEEEVHEGSGAVRLADGTFVDRAVAIRARRTVLLGKQERERTS